ncbi:MAG TPA: hypothetical protein VHD90_10885, partial [Phototrophicaceae bacterium]|nr:hypothetical protein [Phototrophicaceae bacterium]
MSRRTPWAAHESARPDDPSRRCILTVGALSPLIGLNGDPAIESCEAWLARHAEQERLGRRWQEIENRAFKELNWPKLTRLQRARHREKLEMDALYDEMDVLHAQNQALLESLP